MRLANSAFFGHSGQVKDLPQAIMLLGYDRVRAVAIGMSAMHLLPSRTGFQIQNLWAHGYEAAFLASLISERVGLTRPDACFLSGLLHDVGRVIFYLIDHALFQQLETGDDMLEREKRLFGCTHAEAGAWYAELLMLPPELTAVLRYHHHPSAAGDNTGMVSCLSSP
jgi:HD-like signal output (HDOD) protein